MKKTLYLTACPLHINPIQTLHTGWTLKMRIKKIIIKKKGGRGKRKKKEKQKIKGEEKGEGKGRKDERKKKLSLLKSGYI